MCKNFTGDAIEVEVSSRCIIKGCKQLFPCNDIKQKFAWTCLSRTSTRPNVCCGTYKHKITNKTNSIKCLSTKLLVNKLRHLQIFTFEAFEGNVTTRPNSCKPHAGSQLKLKTWPSGSTMKNNELQIFWWNEG